MIKCQVICQYDGCSENFFERNDEKTDDEKADDEIVEDEQIELHLKMG